MPDTPDPRPPARSTGRLAPLREPVFRAFLAARFCSTMGNTLWRAALAWQVFEITGSELQLGVLGLAQFAPTLAFSLMSGAWADAHDRIRIIRGAQWVTLLSSAAVCLATATGELNLWFLYAAVVSSSIAFAFENPAGSAVLPSLVPIEAFPQAVTVLSSVRNAGRLTGPAAMGFIIHSWDLAGAYAVHVALLGISLTCLVFVHTAARPAPGQRANLAAVREGLVFLRGKPAILGAMSLDLFAVIFGGAVALLPVYATEILHVGPRGYGILAAALDAGTVGMGLVLIALPPMRRAGVALLVAVGGFGVATILFGMSQDFSLSVAALVLAGMSDQVSMVARALILQLSTPDALRGRVNAVNMLFIGASNELGAAESGFLAAATSAPFSVVFGGFACLGALALAIVGLPSLRRYRIDAPGG
ncbi:MAG: MFS transporter [Deltaproteobacteria bacterium]|nr:MFS transporter [Deltaproteobacteria bacterium]MBW2415481.1 MFS transporter [Deltaproteobacteria bacterium]